MYPAFQGGPLGVKVDFEEAVQLAAHFGFGGIYLDLPYLMENGPDCVDQMIEERGLKAAGWVLPFSLLAPEDRFAAKLRELPALADACCRAAALRCSIWVHPASDEMTFDEMFEFLRSRLVTVCEILRDNDVRLGLEFIGPATSRRGSKHEFIHTMDGMLELCRAVGTGNVGLLLDCWHLYTSGGAMDDVLRLSDAEIVNVHINDAPPDVPVEEHIDTVRRLPGETGVIDVRRFLQCLQQIGYSGPVMAEPFSERLNAMATQDAIRTTRDAIDNVWPE